MGCHTWFNVPIARSKEAIIDYWKKEKEEQRKQKWWNDECEKDYQSFLINGGYENIDWGNHNDKKFSDLCACYFLLEENNEWILYDDSPKNESYSDEPRIGGYPNRIIRSYKDMLDFMKTGFDYIEDDGLIKHLDFYYDKSRYDQFMLGIKTFFEKHPDGIISFG